MLVDNEDYFRLAQMKWQLLVRGSHTKRYYAINTYVRTIQSNKTIYAHRMVMNAENNQMIDHIDRNGLNNQKSNLRFCTGTENQANRVGWKYRKVKSFKGVSFNKGRNIWVANIGHNNRQFYIGGFKTKEEAAEAYNKIAIELKGQFARLNIVSTPTK